jgi:hypothetical protein
MRITREILLKNATSIVTQAVRSGRDLVAVYLVGSLQNDDPLLGGTADIDLVYIHDHPPAQAREIIRLSPEVTVDIAHHSQTDFNQPRQLRLDPWLGACLVESKIVLHDTQHWFEFTQSSVRAQFYRPENILGRARRFEEPARQIWLSMTQNPPTSYYQMANSFLRAVELGANTIASLTGSPLTDRRFLVLFPERTAAINKGGLSAGLYGLLGGEGLASDMLQSWLPAWSEALSSAAAMPTCPVHLLSARHPYYLRAAQALLNSSTPAAASWPILKTWTRAIGLLGEDHPSCRPWQEALAHLHFDLSPLPEKLDALDAYLDTIEETLDAWAIENGI